MYIDKLYLRATLLGEGKKRDEYGIHLIVVSAHGNTCTMCEPWQGEMLIDDIFSHPSKEYIEENKKKYKLLSEAVESGLLHPNCRHTLTTYFLGITRLPVVPDGKKAIKIYEAEQKQRLYERQIRKWKRIEAGSVDAKNVNDAAKKVKELEYQLTNHLDKNKHLRRTSQREIDKIPIDKASSSDKTIDRKWLKANFSNQKKYDRHIEKHLLEYGDITPED